MKTLYIKQKVFSLSEKFTVTDEAQRPCYYVEGSFLQIPKNFQISDQDQHPIGKITKKMFSLLPKFYVEVDGKETILLEKKLSFLKSHYAITAEGIEVEGNWWDMDFVVFANGNKAAIINQKWFSWGDTYEVTILAEELEHLLISLIIAIDCVKADEKNS